MPIAVFSDLLSALTMHIYSFYLASARIYHWQLTILQSLFHLFRGKKHNVLRNRIDSCDYDLDQLLVGTIFFTLLFFLLPTVVVFYLNFAIARMVIISMKAGFDTLLSCLNHFPLFALMLRVKDPRRLPGKSSSLAGTNRRAGLIEQVESALNFEIPKASRPPPITIVMSRRRLSSTSKSVPRVPDAGTATLTSAQSIPLSFSAMFHQYFQMAHRIRKHYLSPRVLLCLLTGQFVPPINRKNLYSLQYSMLPAKRATAWEMWRALNLELPKKKQLQPRIPALANRGKRAAGSGRMRSHH